MPEESEVHEVEVTIEDVIYKNVRGFFAKRMDTLLTVTLPLGGADRKEIIRLYGAFSFEHDQSIKLYYVLEKRRLLRSFWKKTPYCKIKELKYGRFSILPDQRINLE